ncbi:MAG: ATP-binding cassette domain-containing protein [Candidatus Izemoplasmatales bacterium]
MTTMKSNIITIVINDLTKTYQKNKGIESITTDFRNGTLNLLVGHNGSGKSTLIKCIMQVVNYKGKILKKKYRIGYAPENYVMPDFMTVKEFLIAIGRIKDLYNPYLNLELDEYLSIFDIKSKLNAPIRSLSNGMKQKVNITQALLNQPKIIILDEPLVGLDFNAQKLLIKKIIELSKNYLVIVSTHFPEKFNTSRKRIYKFNQGKLEC